MYEAPILVDVEELAAAAVDGCGICITGGGAAVN